jgi:hypothetical protein
LPLTSLETEVLERLKVQLADFEGAEDWVNLPLYMMRFEWAAAAVSWFYS